MKRFSYPSFILLECAAVFIFFLLPPLFADRPFVLPPAPKGLYNQTVFFLTVIGAAAYEELLYRFYTPHRLHTICHLYFPAITGGTAACFLLTEFPALLLFAAAHRYLGIGSVVFAAAAGAVFRAAYIGFQRIFHPAISLSLLVLVHSLWNMGVYCYLWMQAG
ncbi:MAG: CPBP family glutamic-type intramembrane protease [Treponema sp.]